ncbi:hypothetical protein IscW_ISCW004987 [Ixodes scapularis]|uniref:Uncharacterized protein n=1 Tax=Ixodes scapularis TaxID=6945 RepID=B7PFW0_IXOSC|nr:hypothetical protein IscW_ISCW004987 [Ixodes scapularis]|eukprot:XP_002434082.1 hypothetical protein IscW_ISCW004987 [Ixodes scapularis]
MRGKTRRSVLAPRFALRRTSKAVVRLGRRERAEAAVDRVRGSERVVVVARGPVRGRFAERPSLRCSRLPRSDAINNRGEQSVLPNCSSATSF